MILNYANELKSFGNIIVGDDFSVYVLIGQIINQLSSREEFQVKLTNHAGGAFF